MSVEEAIDELKAMWVEFDYTLHNEACDALDVAIKALEKQILIEHQHTRVNKIDDRIRLSVCPNCFSVNYIYESNFPKYCNWCGQHMIKTFYESRKNKGVSEK